MTPIFEILTYQTVLQNDSVRWELNKWDVYFLTIDEFIALIQAEVMYSTYTN